MSSAAAALGLLTALPSLQAQIPSFPGALGFGGNATGGRTGTVYHVTTLADSGTGSFRDAVGTSGRTVVFDVGGYITLASAVSVKSNITIAGQTAPGGGIGIKGAEVGFANSSNIICRGLRMRPGSPSPSSDDCLSLYQSTNVIVDHCSLEFAKWNNIDAVGADMITVQNSINANPIGQQFGAHTETVGGSYSWFYNIFSSGHNRQPLAKINTVYINNILYNYSAGYTTHTSTRFKHDIINNYFIGGPATGSGGNTWYQIDNNQSMYFTGNLKDVNDDGVLNGSNTVPLPGYQGGGTVLTAPWSTITSTVPTFTTAGAYPYAVSNAGALPRDEMDNLVISQVQTLGKGTTGFTPGTTGPNGSLYTSETQTGLTNSGFGTIASGTALPDSDRDGMPDAWENALGWNPASDDHATLMASSGGVITGTTFFPANTPAGYTRLEEYLHFLSNPHAILPKNTTAAPTSLDIDLRAYASGYTASPTFTVSNVIGGAASQAGAGGYSVHFTPTQDAVGRAMFTFAVRDASGNSSSQTFDILLTANGLPRSLAWVGDNSTNVWDTSSAMWNYNGTLSAFNAGDNAMFDDSGSASPQIGLNGAVSVSSLSVASAKNYTFGGTGSLSILGPLVKDGPSTLTLSTANSITGGVSLNAGAIVAVTSGALGGSAITLNAGSLSIGSNSLSNAFAVPVGAAPTIITTSSAASGIGALTGGGTLNVVNPYVFDLKGDMTAYTGSLVFSGNGGIRFNGTAGGSALTFDLGTGSNGASVRNTAAAIALGALKGGANTVLSGAAQALTYTIGGNGTSTQFDGKIADGTAKTSITKTGSGTLTLNGTMAHTGTTTVSGGTLASLSTFAGPITVAAGGTLAPNNTATSSGTLTAANGFTFSGGTIAYDLTADPASAANDKVTVTTGTLTLSSAGTVKVNLVNGALGAGVYSLIDGAATMSSSNTTPVLSSVIPATGTRQAFAISRGSNGSANGFLRLTVTGAAGSLTWNGASSAWDLQTSSNWTSGATTGNPNQFYNFDTVTFNDSVANGAVTLTGSVQPNVLNVANNNTAYTFSGSGTLDGAGTLVKSGSGTLTISNTGTNTYSGGTFLNGGTLATGVATALGTGPVNLSGGTLSLAAITLANPFVISGNCAISSSGGNIGIVGTTTNTLTSTGNYTVDLSGMGNLLTIGGDMSGFGGTFSFGASGGTLRLNGNTNANFGSAKMLVDLGSGSAVLLNRNGGIAIDIGALQSTGANTSLQGRQTGADVTETDYSIGALNTDNTFAGKIMTGGDQSGVNITKVGTGNWTLSGASSFLGDVIIQQGTLTVAGTLNNGGGDFETENGATLALAGGTISTSLVSITPGATMTGCGTINADLLNQGTVTVSCGGALNVSGNVENDGMMTVNNGSSLAASGSFTNNGTLDLLTSPQTTLPANFINNGTVIYSSNLKVMSVAKSGVDMQIKIQSYTGHNYQLQRTDSLTPANWQPVAGQAYAGTGGVLTLTDAGATGAAQRFYRIQAAP